MWLEMSDVVCGFCERIGWEILQIFVSSRSLLVNLRLTGRDKMFSFFSPANKSRLGTGQLLFGCAVSGEFLGP